VNATASPIDHRTYRDALGRFATGITVVTTSVPRRQGAPVTELDPLFNDRETLGITVSSFMAVSLDPPLVVVSIDKHAKAHATLQTAERFGISVLAEEQGYLSDLFAGRPVARPGQPFEELDGFPVVKGALTQLVVSRHSAFEAGDHTLYFGQVEAVRQQDGEPLLYFRSAYHRLPAPVQPR